MAADTADVFIVSMAGSLLEAMGRMINEAVDALDSAING